MTSDSGLSKLNSRAGDFQVWAMGFGVELIVCRHPEYAKPRYPVSLGDCQTYGSREHIILVKRNGLAFAKHICFLWLQVVQLQPSAAARLTSFR